MKIKVKWSGPNSATYGSVADAKAAIEQLFAEQNMQPESVQMIHNDIVTNLTVVWKPSFVADGQEM